MYTQTKDDKQKISHWWGFSVISDMLHSSYELGKFLGLNGIISAAISLLTFKVQFVILFFKCQNVMLAYILSNVKELPSKDP